MFDICYSRNIITILLCSQRCFEGQNGMGFMDHFMKWKWLALELELKRENGHYKCFLPVLVSFGNSFYSAAGGFPSIVTRVLECSVLFLRHFSPHSALEILGNEMPTYLQWRTIFIVSDLGYDSDLYANDQLIGGTGSGSSGSASRYHHNQRSPPNSRYARPNLQQVRK